MSAFDPATATSDTVADAIRPTLDKFVENAAPFLRKATDELYEQLLYGVQDYLRENGEWNIGQEIERCRKIEHNNTFLRAQNADLLTALRGLINIMSRAESNASGTPEWDVVSTRITFARHVLELASKEQANGR
jgi:hypothetical protein